MVDFIFNIINLILLVVVVILAIKIYVLPALEESFKADLNYVDNLHDKKVELVEAQKMVSEGIDLQRERSEKLRQKIDLWANDVREVVDLNKQEYNNRQLLLKEKIKVQSTRYSLLSAKAKITPEIVDQLRENLIDHFKSKDNVHNFFGRLICNMQKGAKCRENQK